MGTYLRFRFTAGRYHATPWGSHANEAVLEWPPSPWRILRALIATWHRKLDPSRFPEASLASLIDRLSQAKPCYKLPSFVPSHSRHYMPVHGRPVLIFDAFARVNPHEWLVVGWEGLDLADDDRALLGALAERLGYLGRAESWVEAQILSAFDGQFDCVIAGSLIHQARGRLEPIRLLAPISAAEYSLWRSQTITELGLDAPRLSRAKKRKLELIPERLLDALRAETGSIRTAGWNLPPGGAMITYERAQTDSPPLLPPPRSSHPTAPVTTVRFTLAGRPLPRIEDAIRIGETVRAALIRIADNGSGGGAVPVEISGHGASIDLDHQHAFYLPEDADGDGRIDHLLVHARGGLTQPALAALRRLRRLWLDDGHEWHVVYEGEWSAPERSGSPYTQSSSRWVSATPYLHPWHSKKSFGIAEQIARECAGRKLPAPEVSILPSVRVHGRERRPIHFHRFRSKRGLRQPDTRGAMIRLIFPETVVGPLALGFGCHYGLGMFRPEH